MFLNDVKYMILLFMLIMFICQNIYESFNFNLVSKQIQSKVIDTQKKIKKFAGSHPYSNGETGRAPKAAPY